MIIMDLQARCHAAWDEFAADGEFYHTDAEQICFMAGWDAAIESIRANPIQASALLGENKVVRTADSVQGVRTYVPNQDLVVGTEDGKIIAIPTTPPESMNETPPAATIAGKFRHEMFWISHKNNFTEYVELADKLIEQYTAGICAQTIKEMRE